MIHTTNGSTDPTFAGWWTYNPSFNNPFDHQTLGASVTIPLRIFDRNQGEKLRTRLDIDRSDKLAQASRAQVFSDVDSAYAALESTPDPSPAIQGQVFGNGLAGPGHDCFFLRARGRLSAGFSECPS